jgi:hypothetical protein
LPLFAPSPRFKITLSERKGSGGEDMENRFQGLVLFLIGLAILLVAYTISQAETETPVTVFPGTRDIVGISAPTVILWVFGIILVIAGVIWAMIGDRFEVRVHWKG